MRETLKESVKYLISLLGIKEHIKVDADTVFPFPKLLKDINGNYVLKCKDGDNILLIAVELEKINLAKIDERIVFPMVIPFDKSRLFNSLTKPLVEAWSWKRVREKGILREEMDRNVRLFKSFQSSFPNIITNDIDLLFAIVSIYLILSYENELDKELVLHFTNGDGQRYLNFLKKAIYEKPNINLLIKAFNTAGTDYRARLVNNRIEVREWQDFLLLN